MKNFFRIAYHQFIAKVIARNKPFVLNNWFLNTATIYNDTFTPGTHKPVLSGAYDIYKMQYVNTTIDLTFKDGNYFNYIMKCLMLQHRTYNCNMINITMEINSKNYSSPQTLKGDIVAMKIVTNVQKHKYYGYPILLIIKQINNGKERYFNILMMGCTSRRFNQWTSIGKQKLIEMYKQHDGDPEYIEENYDKIYFEAAKFFADFHISLNCINGN